MSDNFCDNTYMQTKLSRKVLYPAIFALVNEKFITKDAEEARQHANMQRNIINNLEARRIAFYKQWTLPATRCSHVVVAS